MNFAGYFTSVSVIHSNDCLKCVVMWELHEKNFMTLLATFSQQKCLVVQITTLIEQSTTVSFSILMLTEVDGL